MAKRRKLIIGNWKMNGLLADLVDFQKILNNSSPSNTDIVIAPPVTLLNEFAKTLRKKNISLSGQNCHDKEKGAYTGEISAKMLKDIGAGYVILGHSERRLNNNETDQLVQTKALSAIENNLVPIICVGEDVEQYRSDETLNVIEKQLNLSINSQILNAKAIIAYEPIWAIGTKIIPEIREIDRVASFIRNFIGIRFGVEISLQCRIIYGGSVNKENARDIFSLREVDGGLIGGASLKVQEFQKLIEILVQATHRSN